MKIVIVGPGAMGCLFASLLVEAGREDVWLFDKDEARAEEIAKNGLRIEGIGGTRSVPTIRVTVDPQELALADFVLIFVKSYDTADAANSISLAVGDNTAVLTLQNGLTNVETISRVFGEDKVVAGVTSHGATMLGIGRIRHAGVGETFIGEPAGGSSSRVKSIADILTSAGIQTAVSSNIHNSIWAKLIINAAINPLTAITKLRNGQLLTYNETRKLLGMVAEEAVSVAVGHHISLPYDDVISTIETVCRATSNNISSMLQDVLKHKRTEIDAINGAIVAQAMKIGMKAQINETLTYLVKGMESQYQNGSK